ncbi:MAG: hypothetical protein QOF90_3257, partial [Acetobacteraceae bacterium]|nr:hypothetical protein [Acetobacteraceae bacterium]
PNRTGHLIKHVADDPGPSRMTRAVVGPG